MMNDFFGTFFRNCFGDAELLLNGNRLKSSDMCRFMVFVENGKIGYVDPRFRVVHLAVDHGDQMFDNMGADFSQMVMVYLEMAANFTLLPRPRIGATVNVHKGNENWLV